MEPAAAVPEIPGCRGREVLGRIGDKWSLYVIHLLGGGTRRFSELRRQIGGITPRMLTVTIRSLERDGLISRTVYPVIPPRVEYALTPLGESLLQAATTLLLWADAHEPDLSAARHRYDEANRDRLAPRRPSPGRTSRLSQRDRARPGPRRRGLARDRRRGFTVFYPPPLNSVAGGARGCGDRTGTRLPRAGAARSPRISLFVEYRQLMSCQNSVIMGRAAMLPGQPGQNGHPRPRPGGRERL